MLTKEKLNNGFIQSGPSYLFETFEELKNNDINNFTNITNTEERKNKTIKKLDELREVLQKSKRKPNNNEMINPNSD